MAAQAQVTGAPHSRTYDEETFPATREGLDRLHHFVRTIVGDAPGGGAVVDTALILAGNTVRHTSAHVLHIQVAVMKAGWQIRVDDGCQTSTPHPRPADDGEPIHGLAALNAAGITWLPLGGAILATIPSPAQDDGEPMLAAAAQRAIDAIG